MSSTSSSSSPAFSSSSFSDSAFKPTPFLGGSWTAGGPDGSTYWSEKVSTPAIVAPDEEELAYYMALLHSMRAPKAGLRSQDTIFVRKLDPIPRPSSDIPESFIRGGDCGGIFGGVGTSSPLAPGDGAGVLSCSKEMCEACPPDSYKV